MCGKPQMPKTYQPTEAVNGVWTPTKAYTQQEQDALYAEAAKPRELMGNGSEGGMGHDGLYTYTPSESQARQEVQLQVNDRNGVVAADAAKLAGMSQQSAKQPGLAQEGKRVRAPVDLAATGGGGGPTSLITGGTASAALTGRKAPTSTFLGG